MSDDAIAGPSLLLARHDLAHREHQHLHQHHKLHKKQGETGAAAVTEVVATVSVVQQIDIDSNGNTLSMILVPASTGDPSPSLTNSLSPTTTTIPIINSAASTVASTVASPPSSNPSLQLPLASSSSRSAPASTVTPSISSSFSSLIASSNSTTLISSSSSLSRTFSNSTRSPSSSSRSSLTYLKFSSSSAFDDSTTKSTSSYYFPSSSLQATSTDAGAYIAGGAGATSGAASSSTAVAGSGSGGSAAEPATPTPIIIGATVSSVAGAAVIILAIVFIWRWKKRSRNMISLGSGGGVDTIQEGDPAQPSGGMVERRSLVYAVPAALASLTGYKRSSQKTETDRTMSSTAGSERGFYRVSGRKLPSVLQSGGDGYGGGIDDKITNTLSGSSFYRDSHGFYGGPGNPSFPPVGISTQRDSGVPVMRPSPARTPVTEHGPFSSVPPPLTPPARRSDVLGRSHPSQDGSHASRFTEQV